MNDIKINTAKNIARLRQQKGMTQLELAERLNYSDKAVSKWEHGDSLPDITVLVELADLFGVTLDTLVRGEEHTPVPPQTDNTRLRRHSIITIVSILLVFFICLLTFVLFCIISGGRLCPWIVFVYGIPVGSIVWLVFNSIWFNRRRNYLIISILMWSVLASIHLSLLLGSIEASLLYLLGLPGQLTILLWSLLKKPAKH